MTLSGIEPATFRFVALLKCGLPTTVVVMPKIMPFKGEKNVVFVFKIVLSVPSSCVLKYYGVFLEYSSSCSEVP